MAKYSTIVHTKEGQADVTTKRRWMGLVPAPHTGVMPYSCSFGDLTRLGVVIKWTTDDPTVLTGLQEAIVRLVQELGVSGLVEIRNSARMTEQVWKTFGGAGSGLQDVVEMAARDGVAFPVPADVLKYIKGFQ